jgi:hypothetical protein
VTQYLNIAEQHDSCVVALEQDGGTNSNRAVAHSAVAVCVQPVLQQGGVQQHASGLHQLHRYCGSVVE